ncbi:DUF4974 domain-containing protein [Mucilaginibacter robiniae]|uniref:DUF4974 domain-containing protein n=1 Tax=Mucilaginibacter robiniae TaxID=2728022 RepID=A0A7L5DZ16_9SPHI|nr:FecR domain-containing protein [Mucilaginibacter robiniae]QJD96235.1 DUF4974 domain-containing protein [Mucilaginibacter robiniae]
MEERHLNDLIRKFLSGEASEAEKKELNTWYEQQADQQAIWPAEKGEQEALEQRMLNRLQNHVYGSAALRIRYRAWYYAAAAITGLLLITGIYVSRIKPHAPAANMIFQSVTAPVQFRENRYVLLPDSSTVLLHSGSSIAFRFDAKARRVNLKGEAYFDVRHRSNQPFTVQAGPVTTTVLGTAFNIKANPGQQIIVSVTRGKVSVSNARKNVMGVLLPDQQLVYRPDQKTVAKQLVTHSAIVAWAGADMQFNDMPFNQLAERLGRRYGVEITFTNATVAKCLISGHFNGMESLDQVLSLLSGTVSATYRIEGHKAFIDGPGC